MGQGVHTVLRQMLCEELGLARRRSRWRSTPATSWGAARRPRPAGPYSAGGRSSMPRRETAGRPGGRDSGRPGRAGVPRRGPHRLDHPARGGGGESGHPFRLRLGDPGGDPRRGRPHREVVAAHDVGKVINPTLLEGQIEGAVHMGLGHALSEEYVVRDGIPVTTTLKSLNIIPPAACRLWSACSSRNTSPRGRTGRRAWARSAWSPPPLRSPGALRRFDGSLPHPAPMKDSPAARAAVPKLARAR